MKPVIILFHWCPEIARNPELKVQKKYLLAMPWWCYWQGRVQVIPKICAVKMTRVVLLFEGPYLARAGNLQNDNRVISHDRFGYRPRRCIVTEKLPRWPNQNSWQRFLQPFVAYASPLLHAPADMMVYPLPTSHFTCVPRPVISLLQPCLRTRSPVTGNSPAYVR